MATKQRSRTTTYDSVSGFFPSVFFFQYYGSWQALHLSVEAQPLVHSLFRAFSTRPIVLKGHDLNRKQLAGPGRVMCWFLSVIACFCGLHLSASASQGAEREFPFYEYLIHNKVFDFILFRPQG